MKRQGAEGGEREGGAGGEGKGENPGKIPGGSRRFHAQLERRKTREDARPYRGLDGGPVLKGSAGILQGMTLFMPLTRSDKLHAPEAVRESEMATGVHGPRLKLERRLAAALGIAISAALVEVFGSLWSGSLALLTDAGHVGTDAVALGLSLAALRIAGRPHTPQMLFGYHRIEVLAAFVNAVLLAAIASSLADRKSTRLNSSHSQI